MFHFQAHSKPLLRTVEEYKEFLKEGVIYNEYDEEVSHEKFWKLVEESLKSDPWDLEPPYSYDNLPEEISPYEMNKNEYMDSGFMFSIGDFS